jgi:tetratricopeptide (TPR) repeat protein
LGDRREEAIQVNGLSWVTGACVGDGDTALWYSHQAYAIAESIGDTAVRGWSRMWGSTAYSGMGREDDALAFAQTALELFTTARDNDGIPQALLRIGSCLERLGRYEEALPVYTTYRQRVTDPALTQAGARADVNRSLAESSLARVYSKIGQWRQAAELLDTAIPLARKVGQQRTLVQLLAMQGEAGFVFGDPTAGERHLTEAIALSEEGGDTDKATVLKQRLAVLASAATPTKLVRTVA